MAALEEQGRRGWHAVDHGVLHHVVEASDHVWEHRRVLWGPGVPTAMATQGWTLVKDTSFPWGYYTRRTDTPVNHTEEARH